jgi:hypothetical protein
MIKKYYIIEPLDIDGDSNPDGFLISQYKLDRNNNKIFLKNKYITYAKFNSLNKKGGQLPKQQLSKQQIPNQNLIVLTPEQYNAFMNNKIQPNQYPQQYPNQYHNQYPQQPLIIRDNHSGSFGNSFMSGLGGGIGFGIGSELVDSIFGE